MRYIFIFTLFLYQLNAQSITLSSEQEKEWNIKTMKPQASSSLPLGEFIAEVTIPPASVRSITLPFEANLQQLYVAKYQEVQKGEVLAKVTGSAWIQAQQAAIADAIALKQQKSTTKRQILLCKEGIIPQKECITSEATLDLLQATSEASKALLESYGAMPEVVDTILSSFKLSQSLDVISPYDGTIKELNAVAGQTISPSQALFVIQQNEKLWLESKISIRNANILKKDQSVKIQMEGESFETKVLQVASIIDSESQTRLVRFDVSGDLSLYPGTRATAAITLNKPVLKVPKKALVNMDAQKILFVKRKLNYIPLRVTILGEDESYYYIPDDPMYRYPIAVTSLAVLKNLIGGEDE